MLKYFFVLFLMVSTSNAFALDPFYFGEWKDAQKDSYLHINSHYFIFREDGRYKVLSSEGHRVVLFTAREDGYLKRGTTCCTLEAYFNSMVLDCGEWKKEYFKIIK